MSLFKNENQFCVFIEDNNMNDNANNKDNMNDINKDINKDINNLKTKTKTKIKRCIAYNKNNNKCRAKIENSDFFCCDSHKPINYDLINSCFICLNKIEDIGELYYFRCKHIMHKECYDEWINYSNYDKHICMICRNEVFKIPDKKNKIRKSGVLNRCDYNKMLHIFNTYNNMSNSSNNQILPVSYTEGGIPLYNF